MAITPKERRAQMIKERGKTESTGINPNSPRARLERQKSQTTKRSSITPKERRAQNIASRGDNFFTRKGTKPAISERAKKIQQAQANVEKDLPRGTPAPSQMEDYKPTAVAKAITKTEKTIAKSPAKNKPGVGGVKAGLSEFGKAFAAARKAGKKDFTFRDKQYATITKQEVQKSGASGLGDYLNKLKRSETKIAKAPGQITKKKGGTITLTGEQKQTAKEKMKARRRAMKGMAKYNVGGSVDERDIERSIEAAKARKAIDRSLMNPKTEKANESISSMDRQRTKGMESPMGRKDRMSGDSLMINGRLIRGRELRRVKAERAAQENIALKNMSGAAVSENEMKSIMEQVGKPQSRDRFSKGGSVMARGGRMGKQKPTKLY
jgi:hypothetical protein